MLTTINDKNIFSYKHFPGEIISGCYAVSAFDAKGNEGEKSAMICVDSAIFMRFQMFLLQMVMILMTDLLQKHQDLLKKLISSFLTGMVCCYSAQKNPKIDWDGTYKGKIVSPGVYFYQCDVYEKRISGLELFHLSGFVHVITEENAKVNKADYKMILRDYNMKKIITLFWIFTDCRYRLRAADC